VRLFAHLFITQRTINAAPALLVVSGMHACCAHRYLSSAPRRRPAQSRSRTSNISRVVQTDSIKFSQKQLTFSIEAVGCVWQVGYHMCTSVAGAALLGLPFAMGLLGEQ